MCKSNFLPILSGLLIVFCVVFFNSCQKEYDCNCTFSYQTDALYYNNQLVNNSSYLTEEATYKLDGPKKDATAECNGLNKDYISYSSYKDSADYSGGNTHTIYTCQIK
jgi:hypothetical protein